LFGIFTGQMHRQKPLISILFFALLMAKSYKPPLTDLYTAQQSSAYSIHCADHAKLSDALLWVIININEYLPDQQSFSDIFTKLIATDFLKNDFTVFQKSGAQRIIENASIYFSSPAIYIFIRVLLI